MKEEMNEIALAKTPRRQGRKESEQGFFLFLPWRLGALARDISGSGQKG
jgi:hypothetical protein